jgi:uncharacterized protein YprB with RNaseH-like and TPR domain
MLRSTFCHIPGVGLKTELRLWCAGITSWQAVLDPPGGGRESPEAVGAARRTARRLDTALLRESVRHYEGANPAWFGERLPAGQVWRLFHDFRDSCAYLDIETTGLSNFGHITTIALYDGRTVRHYVHGDNLEQFPRDVRDYRLLVTYNGKAFDLPFIERCLGARLGQAHIDLRYVLKSLGLRGGLKSCERQLGVDRPGLEDVDGFVAVLLWQEFRRQGNARALESLLAYNIQDAVNLELLMVLAYNRKLAELAEASFTAGFRLPTPASFPNPFRVDAATVQRLLHEYPWPRPFPG